MDDQFRTDDVASLRSMGDTPLARQMLATMMRDLVQSFARRDADLRPARDALAAAEEKKRVGNDAFRAGDYLAAFSAYGEAHERLDAASREPTTSYAAEVLRLVLLSNSAQCALKANNPAGAANFCRDALRLSACTSDERVFKKILVRLALAHEALGEHDKAVAVVAEARIRGLAATEFDALESRLPAAVDRAPDGALPPNVEMRMFIMLALKLSAGAENLERFRGLLQSGQLPHVDRRDEVGNNVLWGVLNALTIPDEKNDDDEKNHKNARDADAAPPPSDPNDDRGGEASVPTLDLLLRAGADPRQRY